MRQPDYSGQFKRDVKLAQKRGKDEKSALAGRCGLWLARRLHAW
jgi:mRNA-degrading endonuclease YafQ of YafQ-DinJ toxin-antitoxin module